MKQYIVLLLLLFAIGVSAQSGGDKEDVQVFVADHYHAVDRDGSSKVKGEIRVIQAQTLLIIQDFSTKSVQLYKYSHIENVEGVKLYIFYGETSTLSAHYEGTCLHLLDEPTAGASFKYVLSLQYVTRLVQKETCSGRRT